jgi:23S rRNA pseudouridine2605 synthase
MVVRAPPDDRFVCVTSESRIGARSLVRPGAKPIPPDRSPIVPPPPRTPNPPQRIAKLLARAGIASRREIERMIEEGRIAIDGEAVATPATLLDSLRGVTVDGMPVKAPSAARLFRYHKPAGLLTTERDPKGRATIYDRLPVGLPRVMPVGRLDLNTEGLLLLTTDGELKRELELPATGVERSYRARVFGEVSQARLEELIHGVEIEGVRYGAIDANLERRTGRNAWVELRLKEGKNREVRRVLEHLGLQVSRLIRTAYGPFPLADMPAGAVDEVNPNDLAVFRKSLGMKPPRYRGEERPEPRDEAPARIARPSPRPARKADPSRAPRAPLDARPSARPARGAPAPQSSRRGEELSTRPPRPARGAPGSTRPPRGGKPSGRPGRPGRRPGPGRK